jgi:CDP-glucose 4,6-dehydratase
MFGKIFNGKRVLVTGHTGFKGSWLAIWLQRLGAEVIGFSNEVPTSPSHFALAGLEDRITHIVGDVRDTQKVAKILQDVAPHFVFHMAAQAIVSSSYEDPLATISTNVLGTANFLEGLRHVNQPCTCVIITSDKCYENVEWVWGYRENDQLGGRDIYSGSKGSAELIFHSFARSFASQFKERGVKLASARAGNVIGGGDWARDRIVADCIRAWQAGDRVEVRSPKATRPWQHVLEPLSGYLRLAQVMTSGGISDGESYNFGPKSQQNLTVLELISELSRIWGHNSDRDSFELTANLPFHEASLLKLNCDKALIELGWQPTLATSECLFLTGDWYRSVLRENANVYELTTKQINYYEAAAVDQKQPWVEQ